MSLAELEGKLIHHVIQTNGPWRSFERGEKAFIVEPNGAGFTVALEFLTVIGWILSVPGKWLAQTTMVRTQPHHVDGDLDDAQMSDLIRQLLGEEAQYDREHSPPNPKILDTTESTTMSLKHIAQDTLNILERGSYIAPSGNEIIVQDRLENAIKRTEMLGFEELEMLMIHRNRPAPRFETCISVTGETTLKAAERLARASNDAVCVLNFASAKNPGGGFLGGAQAQEESLARSSGLYPCLLSQPQFYEFHRKRNNLLYSDRMIYSPGVPVFRTDDGTLLETPYTVAFITSAAPNAGAIATQQPQHLETIPDTLTQRAEYVLAAAERFGHERLILGAWGCGVFRNDPVMVAETFSSLLSGTFLGAFREVVFAVFDSSKNRKIIQAFQAEFERTP